MSKKISVLETTEKFRGNVITFTQNKILLPNGNTTVWDLIKHPGAVAIALYDKSDDKFFMVEQFRLGSNKYELEFCAGKLDVLDKEPKNTIIRETSEELGYSINNLVYLGHIYPSVAFMDENIHLYYGEADKKIKQHLDEDEFLTIVKKSYQEIDELISNGTICDAKTIVLFHHLKKINKKWQ